MLDPGRCANCDRTIDGADQKFCPACGQPTPAHRIDWHFLGHELEHSVLHMDRGILYSLKHLMLRPGHLMRDYIEGRRARQVKPLLLLMIMAAAMVFLAKYFREGDLVGSAMSASAATGAGADKSLDGARITKCLSATEGRHARAKRGMRRPYCGVAGAQRRSSPSRRSSAKRPGPRAMTSRNSAAQVP